MHDAQASPGDSPTSGNVEPWTVGRLLDWTAAFLAKKGAEFPRLDTEVLLAHALGCRRIELYTRFAELAPTDGRERFREHVRRRVEGCPVAYIVERKEFFALEFEVSPAVLIPRPESEFVVVECLRLAKDKPGPGILDLGTGSGNLAVTLAKQLPEARVTAVDLSPAALDMARRNATRHGVAERIVFLGGDLYTRLPEGARFDFILSNPPYIPHHDIAGLAPGVRDFEPHLALDGGVDGFAVLDRILEQAANYLKPGGHLIVEIGAPQEIPARKRFQAHSEFRLAPTIHDHSRHPRVVSACWRSPADQVANA